jgi:hypothetical protein
MDYGTDFLLQDDDIVFTPDGDAELVSGPACVAQDIGQQLKIAPGALVWDTQAGSSMLLFLNDSGADHSAVIAELERVAIADPRVDPTTVKATQVSGGKCRLEFTPLQAIKPEVLDYDLLKGSDDGN